MTTSCRPLQENSESRKTTQLGVSTITKHYNTQYWSLPMDFGHLTEAEEKQYHETLEKAAAFICEGEVVAFPTETVYGLGANGLNSDAVNKIFAAKGRPNDNPLILHIADIAEIEPLTTGLSANAKKLAEHFWPGPLTLVIDKSAIVPDAVSAGLSTVAVRYPSNRYAHDFIAACGCPIAAPSANISGRPSPTNAQDVREDMEGKIAAILDGGHCGIGLESTVVDTTTPIPTILRPGGITYEMLTEVMGAVEIDPALTGNKDFVPKAPGMKYRHYAPKAPMYLLEGQAVSELPNLVQQAVQAGLRVGVLCDAQMKKALENLPKDKLYIGCWGDSYEKLAADLFYLLRDFDRTKPDVILGQGVSEEGIGLAIMNRMRKAAGYQIISRENNEWKAKSSNTLPDFMIQ